MNSTLSKENFVACQAPLSMGFSKQECWSGLPFPPPGDLPNLGIRPGSPALKADSLPPEPRRKPTISKEKFKYIAWHLMSFYFQPTFATIISFLRLICQTTIRIGLISTLAEISTLMILLITAPYSNANSSTKYVLVLPYRGYPQRTSLPPVVWEQSPVSVISLKIPQVFVEWLFPISWYKQLGWADHRPYHLRYWHMTEVLPMIVFHLSGYRYYSKETHLSNDSPKPRTSARTLENKELF